MTPDAQDSNSIDAQSHDLFRRLGLTLREWIEAYAPAIFPHAAVLALIEHATYMAQTGSEAYQSSAADCFRAAMKGDANAFEQAMRSMHDAMIKGGMRHRKNPKGPAYGGSGR